MRESIVLYNVLSIAVCLCG